MRRLFIMFAMAGSAVASLAAQGTQPPPQAPMASTPMAQAGLPPQPSLPVTPMAPQGRQGQPGGQGQQGQGGRGGAMPGQAPQAPQPPQGGVSPQPPDSVPTQNVRVELTIADTLGGASGTNKKTVTMLVADGRNGRIRASTPGSNYVLNVDTRAVVRRDGRIELNVTIEYVPDSNQADARQRPANINESLSVLVPDGKPMVISQSADPTNDRKVTVEVTATIVK